MTDEIQVVARAIEGVRLFVRWNDWTSDHVPGLPIEICRWTGDYDESCEVVARYPGKHENDGEKHLEHHVTEARALSAIAALDAARGDQVARLIAHMKTIEPDEETAGCPATWADFIQILEGIAEAGEPFNG